MSLIIKLTYNYFNSIRWEKYYNFRLRPTPYPRLYIPSEREPRILDPANPTNNLYKTGINGNWTQLVANIDTIDLTKPVESF